MIRVTFLGTAAARPTVGRSVSACAVQREGDLMLIDCGEGTQRQMMRYGTGFGVSRIFFTHLHADHFLGLTGLLRTMGLQGRTDPIDLFGPRGSSGTLQQAVRLGAHRLPFPVNIQELEPGGRFSGKDYGIEAFEVDHGVTAIGYALVEDPRLGRFDPEKAEALGVPYGPALGRLHRGEAIEVEGRWVQPSEVVGPARPGRRIVLSGDTRPCATVIQHAEGADLLVHEATFTQDEEDRARQTGHSTAEEAARVAKMAGVRRLILTHVSARYAEMPGVLEREARAVFPATTVAHDGLIVEVPHRDEGQAVQPVPASETHP